MVYHSLFNDSIDDDESLLFKDDSDIYDYRIYYPGKIENLRKPWIKEPHFILTATVYTLCFIVGLVGNGLVVFAMCADKKSRSVTTSFLVSLALADLLFLLVCVPYEVTKSSIAHWSTGIFLCKFTGFIEMLTAVGSIFNLTAVSIERYIIIVHPMRSRMVCTLGNTRKILSVLWIVSFLMSCPTIYMMGTESQKFHNNNGTEVTLIYCVDGSRPRQQQLTYCVYQFVIMFVAPTLILAVCYSRVIYVLWVSTKQLAQMTFTERRENEGKSHHSFMSASNKRNYRTLTAPNSTISGGNNQIDSTNCCSNTVNMKTGCNDGDSGGANASKRDSGNHIQASKISARSCPVLKRMPREQSAEVLHKRRQVIKMLLAIILVFLLCWGPKLLFRLMRRIDTTPYFTSPILFIKIIFDFSPYIQSCINPVVYFFMSRNFRKSMRYICQQYCCHCVQSKETDVFELETKTMDGNSITTRGTNYCRSVVSKDTDNKNC